MVLQRGYSVKFLDQFVLYGGFSLKYTAWRAVRRRGWGGEGVGSYFAHDALSSRVLPHLRITLLSRINKLFPLLSPHFDGHASYKCSEINNSSSERFVSLLIFLKTSGESTACNEYSKYYLGAVLSTTCR